MERPSRTLTRGTTLTPKFGELADDALEQSRWQQPVVVAILLPWDRPQVIAGQGEDFEIAQHNPRRLIVQSEVALDSQRNFERRFETSRGTVGDRSNRDHRGLAFGLVYDQHDGARAILAAFDVARSASSLQRYEYEITRPTSSCGNSMCNPVAGYFCSFSKSLR